MKTSLYNLLRDNKGLLIFLLLMSVFRSAVADWNTVPTGSMQPTIVEGDRILVNKMAYNVRVPFTHISLIKLADPERGDIVVFDSARAGKRLVKRIIGLPGDVITMQHNVLKINGTVLQYSNADQVAGKRDKIEDLLGFKHTVRIHQLGPTRWSSFDSVQVPANHYLVLGDNRDNSADSRVIGFVPRKEIVGKSAMVVMSLNYDKFYLPRSDRFFHSL